MPLLARQIRRIGPSLPPVGSAVGEQLGATHERHRLPWRWLSGRCGRLSGRVAQIEVPLLCVRAEHKGEENEEEKGEVFHLANQSKREQ